MNMRGIHYKGMRVKSNVIKRNFEKVWGARYLPKNTVHRLTVYIFLIFDLIYF
jgi:hypothetical protein